jgi:hypothetical protein
MMASMGLPYRAKGSRASCVEDTETAAPVKLIAGLVFTFLGVSRRMRPGDLLYPGDQFEPGPEVNRIALAEQFEQLDL